MKIFTRIIYLFILMMSTGSVSAQTKSTAEEPLNKNIVKINLLSLPLGNFHVQYERPIAKKISFGLGFRYMPEGYIPLKSTIIDLIGDPDIEKQINNLKTGNLAITPEIRFYLGKHVLKGFYVAPFARYSKYTASIPYDFEVPTGPSTTRNETIPLSGSVNTLTGGLLFGSQFKLGKMVVLDWWILGPQYGSAEGNISGKRTLNAQEQQALRDELSTLDDLPIETNYTVDGNGALVDFKGPWAGVRAGLCLGIRF